MKTRGIFIRACLGLGLAVLLTLLVLDRLFPPALGKTPFSTLVTARDGTPLRAFADVNGVWRYPTGLDQVSPLYIQALLTYEDRWFHYHPGVNPVAIARAFFTNMAAGRIISGGSTLTMQVARLIRPVERTIRGKCIQILRALQLEWHLSKRQILQLYIDLAPFGANIEGVGTASFSWLGKPPKELSHAEAALLAVLPQAPSRLRPDRHPQSARAARDKVLDRMETFNVWDQKIVAAAKQEPVTAGRYLVPVAAPLAARRLKQQFPGRPHIRTTLDYDLQIHVENLVKDYVSPLGEHQSAAVLVVHTPTMETRVYVGSADFSSTPGSGHVDMVRALRSPGSALKPFLYGMALDKGLIHSHSMLLDIPRFQKEYDPGNFTAGFSGPVTAAQALRLSLNVPAVRLLEALGPQEFHDRLVNAGARLSLPGEPNLSIILGGLGTNLESLVTLYTALVKKGIAVGPVLAAESPTGQGRYLLSEGAAWIIRDILAQPIPGFEKISRFADFTPVAWKTGTSYGFRDAWAIGIMGDYVAGVWVGRPDGSPSIGQYGAVTALPLLNRVFDSLPISDFSTPPPETVTRETICWPLGIAAPSADQNCHVRHRAWTLNHQMPRTLIRKDSGFSPLQKTFWVDQKGKRATPACGGIKKVQVATWPPEAEPFIPKAWRQIRLIPPASDRCPDLLPYFSSPLQITSVFNNSILSCPADESAAPAIPLTVTGGRGKTFWFLNREPKAVLPQGVSGTLPLPLPGAYQLSVADESGSVDAVQFTVIDIR